MLSPTLFQFASSGFAIAFRYVLGDVAGHDFTTVNGSTNADISVSYNLTPKLRLSFEDQNLADVPLRYGRDSQRNDTLLYVHSARSFVLGMTYKY